MDSNFIKDIFRIPLVQHPALSGPLLIPGSAISLGGRSIPSFREIPVGFDAIFQFRSDFLTSEFNKNYSKTFRVARENDVNTLSQAGDHFYGLGATFDYVEEELSDRVNSAITTKVSELVENEISEADGSRRRRPSIADGISQDSFAREPSFFELHVHNPQLQLEAGSSTAQIQWDIDIYVIAAETSGSRESRYVSLPAAMRNRYGYPLGLYIEDRAILLCRGNALISPRIELAKQSSRFQIWARLNFSDSEVSLLSSERLFNDILESSSDLSSATANSFNPLRTSETNITPIMSIGGNLHYDERLSGLSNFQANHVVTGGNLAESLVLSLCVSLGARHGNINMVRPFVGSDNFAYYVSENIIQSVIRSRWLRADTPKVLETQIPVELGVSEDSEETCNGRGRIRFTFRDLSEVALVASDGHSDSLRLSGNYEMRLLNLWDCEDNPVHDLGELANPEIKSFAIHIFLFEDILDTRDSGGKQFLQNLARHLLPPIYRPISDNSLNNRDIRGKTSAALSAVYLTGRLTS